jgi:hypothetical protein
VPLTGVMLLGSAASGGMAATPAHVIATRNGSMFPSLVCQSGEQCVEIHADRSLGSAQAVAEGFTYGVGSSNNSSVVPALRPQSWLADPGTLAFNEARANGAKITAVISDAWYSATWSAQTKSPIPPWSDLSGYGAWVHNYVESVVNAGEAPAYWEVQNEPDGLYGLLKATPAQALAEFKAGVDAIRSVLPSAKIMGPGVSAYNDRPSPTLDIKTFLDFVAAQHIHLDALAWHEVGARANAIYDVPDPQSVAADVARARALIAAHPTIGHPAIVINEYGSAPEHAIPGWTVAWISALEGANVAQANRACWHAPNVYGVNYSECTEGALDGLVVGESSILTQPIYSVHRAYATMTGQRVATSSTDRYVAAFATRDDSAGTVRVLIGRFAPSSAPPEALDVQLDIPWTSTPSTIEVDRIPNQTGALLAPIPVSLTSVTIGGAAIQVPINDVVSGDAYVITVKSIGL